MSAPSRPTLTERVQAVITEVRPVLGLHGGSLELVEITPDNVARVRLSGACVGCAAAGITVEYGLKELLLLRVEELADVEAVNDEPVTHAAPNIPLNFRQ